MQSMCRGRAMTRWLYCGAVALGCLVGVAASEEEQASRPPDLRTRKGGSDWPTFLGPTGDSISTEKGLMTPWPKEGPRVVWETKLGSGYGAPGVSRGRLFIA